MPTKPPLHLFFIPCYIPLVQSIVFALKHRSMWRKREVEVYVVQFMGSDVVANIEAVHNRFDVEGTSYQ